MENKSLPQKIFQLVSDHYTEMMVIHKQPMEEPTLLEDIL